MSRTPASAEEIQLEVEKEFRKIVPAADEREFHSAALPYMLAVPDETGCNWTMPSYAGSPHHTEDFLKAVDIVRAKMNLARPFLGGSAKKLI